MTLIEAMEFLANKSRNGKRREGELRIWEDFDPVLAQGIIHSILPNGEYLRVLPAIAADSQKICSDKQNAKKY